MKYRTVKFEVEQTRKGVKMTKGRGWMLAAGKGRKRVFSGTLLYTINQGPTRRIAIFSVPK